MVRRVWRLALAGSVSLALAGCPQTSDEYLEEISGNTGGAVGGAGGGAGGVGGAAADVVPTVDGEASRVMIPVTLPRGLAHDGTGVWVADVWDDRLVKLSPDDGTELRSIPMLGQGVRSLASVGGKVVLLTTEALLTFDPESMEVTVVEEVSGLLAVARRGQEAVTWEAQGLKLREGDTLIPSVIIDPDADAGPFLHLPDEALYLVAAGPRRPGGAARQLVLRALDATGQRTAPMIGVVEAPVDVERITGMALAPDRSTVLMVAGGPTATEGALISVSLGPLGPERRYPEQAAIVDVQIKGDANGDGWLSPGESAEVEVTLYNGGFVAVGRSQCLVASTHPGLVVSAADNTLNYSNCSGGQSCGSSRFAVRLDPELAVGEVPMQCTLVDDTERTLPLEFALPVREAHARPKVAGIEITNDTNGDGVLNPGESATLLVHLENAGLSTLTRSSCTLPSDPGGLFQVGGDDRLNYSSCRGGADCGQSGFEVKVLEGIADILEPDTVARFQCGLQEEIGAVYTLSLEVPLRPSGAEPIIMWADYEDGAGNPTALDPGMTATVRAHLSNTGTSNLTRSSCEVYSDVPWLNATEQDNRLSFGPCPARTTDCQESTFQVRAEPDAPLRTPATMTCFLEDEEQNGWSVTFELEL